MNPPVPAAGPPKPLWLLAELTYRCPLQCPYCSNPVDFAKQKGELDTDEWLKVLREARAMGATQLGFSGGEPLVRRDLEVLVAEARKLGYYTNLITSGIGMDEARISALKAAGIDHIQLSFQASSRELNDRLAGITAFDHKLAVARMIKAHGFPMVLCFVIHRQNIDSLAAMIELAGELGADYIELASTQYYGWARTNRDQLLPSRDQVRRAEAVAHDYQERFKGRMKIFYVVTDYYEERPKACMNGWGNVFLAVSPDGTALPCHSARQLPGLDFPNVRTSSIAAIWNDSAAFNAFRGDAWMKEPCRSCPEKAKDFGGCRCQAFMLTGEAANADPVCSLSPHHQIVLDAGARITTPAAEAPLRMRNVKNSLA